MMRGEPQLLRVDWIACRGYGVCAIAAPDLVDLDPWGYPIVDEEVPAVDRLVREARRAVAECPALALSLEPAIRRVR
jgi:ferredoxin